MKVSFSLNRKAVEVEVEEKATLLWTLRDKFQLTGTKYSCGIAQCGSCTVHIEGNPVRSCMMPMRAIAGKDIVTIEGLSEGDTKHALQDAWVEEQVPQCGYCQSGQIMQAAALLKKNPNPTREEIVDYMDGVLCRCGAYMRIISAIQRVATKG
ncbi:MAG: (2Fe-2S)-binding protein [Saprospiraceae bacterium]|nr:(2Fe-2S)-binding protein [Saprospiraceae bacterium]